MLIVQAVIGLTASFLTFILFFEGFQWKKVIIFFVVAGFSTGVLWAWSSAKESEKQLAILQNEEANLKKDSPLGKGYGWDFLEVCNFSPKLDKRIYSCCVNFVLSK